MKNKTKILNLIIFSLIFLPGVSKACSYIENVTLWSNCEGGVQVALEANVTTLPGEICPDDAIVTRTCGVYDGVCTVGYMSDFISSDYLKANNVQSVMPDGSVFYNFDDPKYIITNDPDGDVIKSDMSKVDLLVMADADSETNVGRWPYGYWDLHFEGAVKPSYNNGMSIMTLGDHSGCISHSSWASDKCTYADNLVRPVVNDLQSSFNWAGDGGYPNTVSWTYGWMGSSIPFFDGLFFDTRTKGLHTPGRIIRKSGAPDTCLRYVNGRCIFGYIEPSGSKGWLTFDGNIGFSTYDSLSGDTVTGASIFDAIADCGGGVSIGNAPYTNLIANPAVVVSGESSNLSWSSTNNPTSCSATGDWSGEKAGLSPEVIDNITATKNFRLQCVNNEGPGNIASASINVLDCQSILPSCNLPASNVDALCLNATQVTGPTEVASGFEWRCDYIPADPSGITKSKTCASIKQVSEDGICGGSNNGTFSILNDGDSNLCSSGAMANFTENSDGWTWDCDGTCGNTNSESCSAEKGSSSNWIEVPAN